MQVNIRRPEAKQWRVTLGGNPPLERILHWAELPEEVKVKYLLAASMSDNPNDITLSVSDAAIDKLGMPRQSPYNFVKLSWYAEKTSYTFD